MTEEQIETNIDKHSELLIRLDERVGNLKEIDQRVNRLNNYFQICGILLLVLGIGGGYLVSRFFDAQREIDNLTVKLKDSEQALTNQLETAKKQFDAHVSSNPIVTTLNEKISQFDKAFATLDGSPTGGNVTRDREGSEDDGVRIIKCPQGTYIYGLRVSFNKGDSHGIVHHVEPLYKPFLVSTAKK